MYTKIKNILFSFSCLLVASLVAVSCSDEETGVGYSTLNPNEGTSATITVTGGNSFTVNDGVDTEIPFTVTLNQPQVVDITVNIKQIAGDATEGEDFSLSASQIVIPAYSTTVSGSIKVLKDELAEDTETFTIQIADQTTANASITPVNVDFTITNFTDGDLAIDLEWVISEKTTDNSGEELDPVDFADMVLSISSTPDTAGDIDVADGAGFEGLVLPADTPDGTYYVVASFWSANEDIIRDLDLMLTLNQVGNINDQVSTYEKAISNLGTCDLNYYVMNKIIKSGSTYTFEDISTQSYELSPYMSWPNGSDVIDSYAPTGWPSHIITKDVCDGFFIKGLNAEWMLNIWGEEIQPDTEVDVYALLNSDGTFTIEEQFIYTTIYDGAPYDYTVSGSGTYDLDAGTLHIEYNLDQDGFSPNDYWFGEGEMTTKNFIADVTIN